MREHVNPCGRALPVRTTRQGPSPEQVELPLDRPQRRFPQPGAHSYPAPRSGLRRDPVGSKGKRDPTGRFHPSNTRNPITKKRSPETLEKRRRAQEKGRKRAAKLADRVDRNYEKKAIKDGTWVPHPDAEPRSEEDGPPETGRARFSDD